jgi:hypothetical protein
VYEPFVAWQNPVPESLILVVPEWHHDIAILSFPILNKLFILPVPEILVVDVVGAYRIMFRSSRILFFLLKFRFFLTSNPPR